MIANNNGVCNKKHKVITAITANNNNDILNFHNSDFGKLTTFLIFSLPLSIAIVKDRHPRRESMVVNFVLTVAARTELTLR